MNAILFKGTLTEEQYSAALNTRRRKRGQASNFSTVVLLLLILSPILFSLIFAPQYFLFAGAGVLGFSILTVCLMFAVGYFQHQTWQNNPRMREYTTGQVSEAGIQVQSSTSSSIIDWSTFGQKEMTDDLVILYIGANAFLLLPRSHFNTDEEWLTFRKLVESKVHNTELHKVSPPKQKGRSSLIVTIIILSILVVLFIIGFWQTSV